MTRHKKTFWQYLSENATKGRISTALGIILVVGAIASVFMGKADWTQASIAITAGFAAIGFIGKTNDKNNDKSVDKNG
ncbi:hypothetical protein [Leptospira alexanderi]|uniref:hypothetical protein n=1 Tax=Leptospira alexanderi TaxID=100053 RepID=UPI000990E05E|nr:hypothetical protein [Leptospira alexanderi]